MNFMGHMDVSALVAQLKANPSLWDENKLRTATYKESPHRDAHDIWLRYRDLAEFDKDDPQAFSGKHESVWYPAINVLTEAKELIDIICNAQGCAELGGILITRVPPGKAVYPHSDAGHWHPDYYISKYLLLLSSAPGQTFCFENEQHTGNTGDLFLFDNSKVHWVTNDSDVDRISLIIAMRTHYDNSKDGNNEQTIST